MYMLLVVAWMASGLSYATHDFPEKSTCQSMKYALEKNKEYQIKGICVAK
jgi:hypothetical protein